MDNRVEAVNLLVAFTPHVPHIQVTNQLDLNVAEARNGKILYPGVSERAAPKMIKALQKFTIASGPRALDQTLKAYQATLKEYKRHQRLRHRDAELAQQIKAALMLRELKLRALAAQRDLN